MKSATQRVSLKLTSLVLIFAAIAFLFFIASKALAQTNCDAWPPGLKPPECSTNNSIQTLSVNPSPSSQSDINDALCEAIYINGTGVPNGGTYPNPINTGETFRVEIKMKNTGQRDWKKDQNYKLGISYPPGSLQDFDGWGTNRIEIPNNNAVAQNQTAIFSSDFSAAKSINGVTTKTGTYPFPWQMLRERTANDPGGRFGQTCNIKINLVGTDNTTPNTVSNPDPKYPISMITQTACINNAKNLEQVSAKWVPVAGAKSYTATFYEQGGASGFSGCLDGDKNSFTFAKQYDATKKYDISVISYAGANCDGGVANQNKIQVANGFGGAISDGWKYDSIKFNLAGQTNTIDFPLNTCAPFKLNLPKPTGTSTDIPVKITVTRSQYDDKLQAKNNALNEPHTVIFKYQPALEDTNTNDSGNSDSGSASESTPGSDSGTEGTSE